MKNFSPSSLLIFFTPWMGFWPSSKSASIAALRSRIRLSSSWSLAIELEKRYNIDRLCIKRILAVDCSRGKSGSTVGICCQRGRQEKTITVADRSLFNTGSDPIDLDPIFLFITVSTSGFLWVGRFESWDRALSLSPPLI